MSPLPEQISSALNTLGLWCQNHEVTTEIRKGGIRTLDFGQDRVVTVVPKWNNFSALADKDLTDYHYLKLWVPVNDLDHSAFENSVLTSIPFSLGQYPAADEEEPSSTWPSQGELGMVHTHVLNNSSQNTALDCEDFANTCLSLIVCAQFFELAR